MNARTGTYWDLYTATRPTRDASWGPRVNLGPVINWPDGGGGFGWGADFGGTISPDDLELFFSSFRPGVIGSADIYMSTRATPSDPWGPPVNLGTTVNTSEWELPLAISPDGLVLFIAAENRPGGFGGVDTWMIRRLYKGAAWSEPVNLGPSFNTPRGEFLCSISPDGQSVYISEYDVAPVGDLWMAQIIPSVDFDADGTVDLVDLVMLIDNWGTNQTLCDIGPMPWGDGKVDIKDLKVFMAEWEKENPPVQP